MIANNNDCKLDECGAFESQAPPGAWCDVSFIGVAPKGGW